MVNRMEAAPDVVSGGMGTIGTATTFESDTLPSVLYSEPRLPLAEIGRRGEVLYEPLRAQMEAEHRGAFLSIDVETGEYAVGSTSREACDALLAKKSGALLYTVHIGFRTAGKI